MALPAAEKLNILRLQSLLKSSQVDLVCVMGPTASGKTRLAVRMARALGAEVISADSRQVYRSMDIGTGKDMQEYGEIPVHLVDIVPAGEKYNIHRYQKDFSAAYEDVISRGKNVILCGGSGLYVEAATCGYRLPDVPCNEALRKSLEGRSLEELSDLLSTLAPLHNSTDTLSPKRAIRAIEIALYQKEHPLHQTDFLPKKTFYIATVLSRDERNRRIDERLDERLSQGLVEEVRGLLESGIPPRDLIYYGLEYKYVTLYVMGELTYGQMRSDLSTAIHQFAKRQMTWLRGMERDGKVIHWVDPADPFE